MIGRSTTLFYAVLAVALGVASAVNAYLELHWFDPLSLAGFAVIGVGLLYSELNTSSRRVSHLQERTGRLTELIEELESFTTQLEAANARLKASEARYKGLVDAQGGAIMRRTPDGRLTYGNEAFFALFGLRPEQAIGQSFRPESHPESPLPEAGRWTDRKGSWERVSYDWRMRTADGYRWIAWEDYAIRDANGGLIEIQSVGHDITGRKGLEDALTEARDKAEDANRAKSHFLATMSHEIRTPMNGVLGMARLLLETNLAPDQKTYADSIRESGLSLMALIEDILDFSKIESGALIIEKGDVALRPLIEGTVELLSTRAYSKNIEIATAIAPEVSNVIKADGIRLRQVLTNLVGNAIKFTEQGGVLVSASVEKLPSGDGAMALRVSVRDTGIGVPPEKRTEIFRDFVQADSSHGRRFEGTGLGLSISKRLVDAMGGEIGVSAPEEHGSIFSFTLPLEELPARRAQRPLQGKRVAMVSGSPILLLGMRLQLITAGADVIEAKSVKALSRRRRQTDFVLVDAGWSEAEPLPDVGTLGIPAVALLLPSQRADIDQLAAKGYRAYLMKPVRQDSLERHLSEVAVAAGPRSIAAAPAVEPRAKASLRILLAEDNPVNALLARELLRRRGHNVEQVTTGEDAVSACLGARFDLVIMDLHMPGLDGIEATRRIRAAEAIQGGGRLPIFALTADALDTGRKACLEAGMDGFLTKPVDPAELEAVLASITPPAIIAAE